LQVYQSFSIAVMQYCIFGTPIQFWRQYKNHSQASG